MEHCIYNRASFNKIVQTLTYKDDTNYNLEEQYDDIYEQYEQQEEDYMDKLYKIDYQDTKPHIIEIEPKTKQTKTEKCEIMIDEMKEIENETKKINIKIIENYIIYYISSILQAKYAKNINYEKKREEICNNFKIMIDGIELKINLFQKMNINIIYEKIKDRILKSNNQLECINKIKKECQNSYVLFNLNIKRILKYMLEHNYKQYHINNLEIILV